MNKLLQRLTNEVAKQEAKPKAHARVPGYRQNETSRAALETARGKQTFAVSWRRAVIATGADSVRTLTVSTRRKGFRVNVYSKDGVDLIALAPAAPQFFRFETRDERGEKDAESFYRALGMRVTDKA